MSFSPKMAESNEKNEIFPKFAFSCEFEIIMRLSDKNKLPPTLVGGLVKQERRL